MLVELTIEANEESFVIVLQHGGNDNQYDPAELVDQSVCADISLRHSTY